MSEVVLLGGPSRGRGVTEVSVEICKEQNLTFYKCKEFCLLAKELSGNVSVLPMCTCFLPPALCKDRQLFLLRRGGVLSIRRSLYSKLEVAYCPRRLLFEYMTVQIFVG